MIYIVHGDDFAKSRNLVLNQQKKLGVESRVELNVEDVTPENLFSHVHSSGLFGETQYIILNISKAGHTNLEPFIQKVGKIPQNVILVILSDKILTNSNAFIKQTAKLDARIVLNQKAPLSNTFKFVDALFYKQRDTAYRELSKLVEDQVDPFELFSMIGWGLRNVTQASFNNQNFFRGKEFTKNKAYSQAKLFGTKALAQLYSELAKMDKEVKTGGIDPELLVPLTVEKVLNS